MASIPPTSVTLLKDLSGDATSVRWTEFHDKYSGPMRAFLRTHYPTVEADDVIQEVLIALMKCLPHYQYVPDEHGYFHNYLMGIVKHKAEDALRHMKFRTILISELEKEAKERMKHLRRPDDEAEEAAWQENTQEAALQQLLADGSILPSTREIFRHVALMQEPPAKVAAEFGTTRNNVDQIKRRMIVRLSGMVRSMNLPLASS